MFASPVSPDISWTSQLRLKLPYVRHHLSYRTKTWTDLRRHKQPYYQEIRFIHQDVSVMFMKEEASATRLTFQASALLGFPPGKAPNPQPLARWSGAAGLSQRSAQSQQVTWPEPPTAMSPLCVWSNRLHLETSLHSHSLFSRLILLVCVVVFWSRHK